MAASDTPPGKGLRVPKNPALALRALNTEHARGSETADNEGQSASASPDASGQEPESSPRSDETGRDTELRTSASTELRTSVSTQPSTDFLERVRAAISQRTTHVGGVKATVEMPSELSLRAKRYCLDHGNVPVRQVFLELMIAFLEEEGY
jgi:hypothetical protein